MKPSEPRYPLDTDALIQFEEGEPGHLAHAVNLSAQGACLAIPRELATRIGDAGLVGTSKSLLVAIGEHPREACHVVWREDDGEGQSRIGLRFTAPIVALQEPALPETGRSSTFALECEQDKLQAALRELCGNHAIDLSLPLKNIVYRMCKAGATHVLLQHEYPDELHRQEYLALYNGMFTVPPLCKRLFFFRRNSDSIDFLGAVVVRPFALIAEGRLLGQVGRSIILPMFGAHPSDGTRTYCIGTRFRAFAVDRMEELVTVPYLQQDTLGSRCGQVALHVMSMFLHKYLDMKELSPEEIRRITESPAKPATPLRGLSNRAAYRVVAAMGSDPRLYLRDDVQSIGASANGRYYQDDEDIVSERLNFRDFVELLHIYLDSQLPVMLMLRRESSRQRHAICAVGHSVLISPRFDRLRKLDHEGKFDSTAAFLRDIIVHDDEIGPFLHLPVLRAEEYSEYEEVTGSEGPEQRSVHALWDTSVEHHVEGMLVPLPPGVFMPAETLIRRLGRILPREVEKLYRNEVRDPSNEHQRAFLDALTSGGIVTSTYLDLANRFRANVLASELGDEDDAALLNDVSLPRYVWIVELSTTAYMRKNNGEGEMLGFMICDATGSFYSSEPFLAMRLPGAFLISNPRAPTGWQSCTCSSIPFGHLLARNFSADGIAHLE